MTIIQENLHHLNQTIRSLEEKYHRHSHSVSLLAISKGQSAESIQQAIDAGHYSFGENYVQEALGKMAMITHPQLQWHFTGSIQSNKTHAIAELFSWAHTVTSKKHAQRLNEQRPKDLPPLQICLEVNVSQEASKSGIITLAELKELAEYCLGLPRLKLRGLMTMPAPKPNLAEQRGELHKLVMMKEELGKQGIQLDTLSMGMTGDMEAAIAEGATLLRVGRGIFGQRE